jgi:hypothetical protein
MSARRIFTSISLILVLSCASSFGKYSGGSGEPNDPYLIATPEDLNSVGLDPCDWDKHFLMTADINMAGYFFSAAVIPASFAGNFDGGDNTISNLVITGGSNLGLFAELSDGSCVQNLNIQNVNIESIGDSSLVGGLCGNSTGSTIRNCSIEGIVGGSDCTEVGGIAGYISYTGTSTISNCRVNCDVYGRSCVGGIVGEVMGWPIVSSISDCSFNGRMEYNQGYYAGGLVGFIYNARLERCSVEVSISESILPGGSGNYIGGIAGFAWDTRVEECHVTNTSVGGQMYVGGLIGFYRVYTHHPGANEKIIACSVKSTKVLGDGWVGGFIGYSEGVINRSFVDDVLVSGYIKIGDYFDDIPYNGALLGGFEGCNEGWISDCYSHGVVRGDVFVGGFLGLNNSGEVENCYTTTEVTGSIVGGLCSYNNEGTIECSFWDVNTK